MPDLSSSASGVMASQLAEGVRLISENQVISFTVYLKYVLPIDGFIFWIKQDTTLDIQGSLHYVTESRQEVDSTQAVNSVIFTSTQPVQQFNVIDPCTTYIGNFDDIDFAFNQRGSYYQQSGLHHYVGNAVYPTMRTQLLESSADLPVTQVLSNSVPVWMGLDGDYIPYYLSNVKYPVYPSYLVPDNIKPPYIAVEIIDTTSIQSTPYYYNLVSGNSVTAFRDQLVKDRVILHLYGFNSMQAQSYLDYVLFYMQTYGDQYLGLMNMPSISDGIRTQSELSIRAMYKTINFEVSYYQSQSLQSALRLIQHTIPNFDIESTFVGPGWRVPPSGL